MKTLKKSWAVAGVAALALTVGACGSDDGGGADTGDTSATSAQAPESLEGKSVYLVGSGDVNPWTKTFNHAVLDSLKEEGVETTYLQDPFDPQQQVENLNRAVAAKPDLILLLGLDTRSLLPGSAKAKAAGIDVINLSNPPGPLAPEIVASIESDHKLLGRAAAENIVEGLQKQGKDSGNIVLITGNSGANQVAVRVDAFKEELAKTPGLKIVAEENGNWDQATSQKIAQQLIAKYRDKGGIQGVYGMADNQALGVIAAVEQAGLEAGGKEGIVVTGSNCYKFGLDAIRAGKMYGSATQSPKEEAAFTADLVKKHLRGEEIPARSYAPEQRITKANVEEVAAADACP